MNKCLVLLLAAAVAGCGQPPPGSGPAVTTTPSEDSKPIKFETAPLLVAVDAVKEQDVAVLSGAEWTTKQCSLTLPGVPESQADIDATVGGPTRLAGFFIDPSDQPAGAFEVVLKGEPINYSIPAKTGWDRSDVADFFKMPQLVSSGYDLMVDLSGVAAGRYKIDYMVDRGGKKFFCESGKHLVVKQPVADAAAQPTAN